jgi:hypothetical protein
MEWSVVKIGIEQFDILHAYGLGILLATACGEPVKLRATACHYILTCSVIQLPRMHCDVLLAKVLPLPGEEDVQAYISRPGEQKLPVTVLDGLLTALFTTPGPRILSVSDLLGKQRLDAKALQRGLYKVAKSISRWEALAGRAASGKDVDWLTDVLRDYDRAHPASPFLVVGRSERDINALMMIDPSFALSLRSARSDGRMTSKTQVALRGTRYGALLAFVGAARFLRAQRLSGELVNCYVPIARSISISADTSLPMLFPADESPDQAAFRRWLVLSNEVSQTAIDWSGLAYQTLLSTKGVRDEMESLLDCLKRRSADAWITHLRIMAQRTHMLPESNRWRYSLEEARTITEVMNNSEHIPLKQVLDREKGTRCFGRALRQIGRYNPSRLCDLLEELEEVQTRAQLLPVLYRIVLASELVKAKEGKIIVPSEDDCAALLEDVDRYGIPVLVGLLLVLSALRYPQNDNMLKYELSTLMRALIALAVQMGPVRIAENDESSLPHELFIDDPEIQRGLLEEREEL